MSILVKGMKMPSECEYCSLCRYYPENGNVWCNAKNRLLKQGWKEPHWTHLDVKRPDWCPLIELPEKYGSLVDADVLIEELKNCHIPGAPYVDAGISIAIGKVCNASTIIEAEGD